jgi:hypothetical protein
MQREEDVNLEDERDDDHFEEENEELKQDYFDQNSNYLSEEYTKELRY